MSKGYDRTIRRINILMSDGKIRHTMEIYDYLKVNTKYGATTQSLANILAKLMFKEIERVGTTKVHSFMSGGGKMALWQKRGVDKHGSKKKDS